MKSRFLVLLAAVLAIHILPALARQDSRREGSHEVNTLADQEAENQGLAVVLNELRRAEKSFGPLHPKVARLLNTLGGLYYDQGKFDQAEILYMRSLVIRVNTLGPQHIDVARSLNNLALAVVAQGRYVEAEPIYQRALEIQNKVLGSINVETASTLNNLGALYDKQDQYSEAVEYYSRALAIREKILGKNHALFALTLNNLAVVHDNQGNFAAAEPLYKRALAIHEKNLGNSHPYVALDLNNLAGLYRTQGHYSQAEPLLRRALSIREHALGRNHPDVAVTLRDLADLYEKKSDYSNAESLYKKALAIHENALGPEHPDVALDVNNIAVLYMHQGKYTEAESLFRRALSIRESVLGPNHRDTAATLSNLAILHIVQGDGSKAGPLINHSLEILAKSVGADHPDYAASLKDLGRISVDYRQYTQAESLFKRALAIYENAYGLDHPDVATLLVDLGGVYVHQRQNIEAELCFMRALAIYARHFGPDHPNLAATLANLAVLYGRNGQYVEAEKLLQRSLAIHQKSVGSDHPRVAFVLHNLAVNYDNQGLYAAAEPVFKQAIAMFEKTLGGNHPQVAASLNDLAALYSAQGLNDQALTTARKSSSIYMQRIVAGGSEPVVVREARNNSFGFAQHLQLLSINPANEPTNALAAESIIIVQLHQASNTSSAVAKMASRFASGNDSIAALVKRKQDSIERMMQAEARLIEVFSKSKANRLSDDERQLRIAIATASKEIGTIDAELTRRFPEYQELTRVEPLTASQVSALLKSDEAMLVYSLGPAPYSFLWVLKPEGVVFMPLPIDIWDIGKRISTVRAEMEFDGGDRPKPANVSLLHELYQSLFAPALPYLVDVKHVVVVPSGPLQSLPFSMMVASPAPSIKGDIDYRAVDWLAKHYAISVLPSVGSIQALRHFAKSSPAQEPFAGFGDPLIGDDSSSARGKRRRIDVSAVFRNAPTSPAVGAGAHGVGIADVEAIRNTPRLPETADELIAMAKVMKASPKSLWLRESATEAKLKAEDLSMYRTIAFATHGLMAGEINGVGEPGLILTPPQVGSIDDDGYLAASEIARLNLNADWVVLSACNTAAADGTPGAEGLSGMAKAFFYAGARSLLVSHWPVDSAATVPLTTGMLMQYESNRGQGKAEAHRQAMLDLMAMPDHPEFAHPIFWAPFVVVGEGGRGMTTRARPGRGEE